MIQSFRVLRGDDAWREWLYEVAWQPHPYFGLLSDYLPTPAVNMARSSLYSLGRTRLGMRISAPFNLCADLPKREREKVLKTPS